jgi:DNA damage-inducible protein 1
VKVQVGSVFFLSSFTILDTEGGAEFLLGLDQLRKHRASIDLEKNCLRILGQDIQFLAEKDLAPSARGFGEEKEAERRRPSVPAPLSPLPPQPARPTPVAQLQPTTLPPGPAGATGVVGGQLGAASARAPINLPAVPISAAPRAMEVDAGGGGAGGAGGAGSSAGSSEAKVRTLMELGFSRSEAERALQLNGGNEERAASFLFAQQFGE